MLADNRRQPQVRFGKMTPSEKFEPLPVALFFATRFYPCRLLYAREKKRLILGSRKPDEPRVVFKVERYLLENAFVISAWIEHRVREEADCQSATSYFLSELLCVLNILDAWPSRFELRRAAFLEAS